MQDALKDIPGSSKDEKVFADAVFNSKIQVVLSTDREHLANETVTKLLRGKGLDQKIRILTPKELFEHLQLVS